MRDTGGEEWEQRFALTREEKRLRAALTSSIYPVIVLWDIFICTWIYHHKAGNERFHTVETIGLAG